MSDITPIELIKDLHQQHMRRVNDAGRGGATEQRAAMVRTNLRALEGLDLGDPHVAETVARVTYFLVNMGASMAGGHDEVGRLIGTKRALSGLHQAAVESLLTQSLISVPRNIRIPRMEQP